jgi:anti-sigma factor RsiW
MNCREIRDLLVPYLDGEVSNAEQTLIRAHVAQCVHCQRALADLSNLHGRLSLSLRAHASAAVPPARAWERLQAQLAAQPRWTRQRNWLQRLMDALSLPAQALFGTLVRATAVSAFVVALVAGVAVTGAPEQMVHGVHLAPVRAPTRLSTAAATRRMENVETLSAEAAFELAVSRIDWSEVKAAITSHGYLVSGRWVSE